MKRDWRQSAFNNASYSNIVIDASCDEKTIHMSSNILFEDKNYVLNGMMCYGDSAYDDWGYGTDEEITEVYEKDFGKAYFVNQDGVVGVYFVYDNILYQLYLTGEEGDLAINNGKLLIDGIKP